MNDEEFNYDDPGLFVNNAVGKRLYSAADYDALRTIAEQLAEALGRIERLPGTHLVLHEARAALEAWEAYRKNDGGGYANGKG